MCNNTGQNEDSNHCQLLHVYSKNTMKYFSFIVANAFLILICITGDKFAVLYSKSLIGALVDSTTHALIAATCWFILLLPLYSETFKLLELSNYEILQIFIAGLCGSLIDIDHFIAAQSFDLKKATSLRNRPFLHCSTIPVVILIILFTYRASKTLQHYFPVKLLKIDNNLGWILVIALISHHLRDGYRRGLWFYPFGSTRPLPYLLYLVLELTCANFLKLCFSNDADKSKNNCYCQDIV